MVTCSQVCHKGRTSSCGADPGGTSTSADAAHSFGGYARTRLVDCAEGRGEFQQGRLCLRVDPISLRSRSRHELAIVQRHAGDQDEGVQLGLSRLELRVPSGNPDASDRLIVESKDCIKHPVKLGELPRALSRSRSARRNATTATATEATATAIVGTSSSIRSRLTSYGEMRTATARGRCSRRSRDRTHARWQERIRESSVGDRARAAECRRRSS